MAGRYERVNTQDDDPDTPVTPYALHPQRIPNSPPPSFHSRGSSLERRRQDLDSDLADAFDTDGEDSDDEPDDRQRLVRAHSFPISQGAPAGSTNTSAEGQPGSFGTSQQATQGRPGASSGSDGPRSSRIYGGGIQSDGVFSNMTARPERGEKIIEEAPPVGSLFIPVLRPVRVTDSYYRHTSKLLPMLRRRTGRQRFWHPDLVGWMKSTLTVCLWDPSLTSYGMASSACGILSSSCSHIYYILHMHRRTERSLVSAYN